MLKKIVIFLSLSSFVFAMGGPSIVTTTKIIEGEVNPLQKITGSVGFNKKSKLAAQNSGVVKQINFEVGDVVKKGTILVKIDSALLDAQIVAAQATLNSAKNSSTNSTKDFKRYEKLLATKSITQKEFDDSLLKENSASDQVRVLAATLKQLQIQRTQKDIRAVYDGVIISKNINLGEWANPGSVVATIVNTKEVEFNFNVPSTFVNGLDKSATYDVTVDGKIIKAKLAAAIVSGDKLTRTFPVKLKVNVSKGFFYEGQEVSVNFSKNAKIKALLVPRDAVIKRFGANMVFLNVNEAALMLPVQILGFMGKQVAIAGKGVVKGAEVVVKGNERIFPKSPLKVINANAK